MEAALTRKLRDPILWNDVAQLLKTAFAAVVAWVLAAAVLELPQPFLAPWAALLVVHATVFRTFSEGMKQAAATVVAVLLAAGVGQALGLDTVAVAVLLVVGLTLGFLPWFGAEATTVATTGLIILTTGFDDGVALLQRLADSGIGIGVGLVVNLAVWPPLLRRTAITTLNRIDDRIGELLEDIGTTLESGWEEAKVEEWVERTRDLDAELDQAWALVRQARESARMNPRRAAGQFRDPQQWHRLLRRMEQALAETRSLARTLGGLVGSREEEPSFDDAWAALLAAAGRAIVDADAEEIQVVRQRLEELVCTLDSGGPLSHRWPIHGALVVNLGNILDAMDEVADANPLDDPPRPLDRMRWRAAVSRVDRAMRRHRH